MYPNLKGAEDLRLCTMRKEHLDKIERCKSPDEAKIWIKVSIVLSAIFGAIIGEGIDDEIGCFFGVVVGLVVRGIAAVFTMVVVEISENTKQTAIIHVKNLKF